jgi:hypothetical protein
MKTSLILSSLTKRSNPMHNSVIAVKMSGISQLASNEAPIRKDIRNIKVR